MSCPFKYCQTKICCKDNWLFGVFLIAALAIWIFNLNQTLFFTINSWHVLLPIQIWRGINSLSDSKHFILPVLLLIATLIWRRDMLTRVFLLIVAYYVIFALLKVVVHEARPYMMLPGGSFYWLNQYEDAVKVAHKSFPSGHAGNAAIFAFALSSFTSRRWLKVLLFMFVVIVCLSRICTGWHWPLDVISSGLISYLLVRVCLCRCKRQQV